MKLWIYGKVMSGKTTFASQFEDAYIISTDRKCGIHICT